MEEGSWENSLLYRKRQEELGLISLWKWRVVKGMIDHPGHLSFSYGF